MSEYDVTTDVGRVRLLINDRDYTEQEFSDAEIETAIEMADGDLYVAASDLLEAWAAKLAARAHDLQLGDYREMTHHAAREMREAAKRLRDRATAQPAFAITGKAWDGPLGYAGHDRLINAALRGEL